MPRSVVVWRGWAASIVAVLAAIAMMVAVPGAGHAAPPDEGNNKTLREKLEAAAKGHIEAQAALDKSRKRQLAFKIELQQLDLRLKALQVQVGAVAAESYRFGRLSAMTTLLNSRTPEDFLERAASLDLMAQRDGTVLRDLTRTFEESQRAKGALDAEVREAAKQVKVMALQQEGRRAGPRQRRRATGGRLHQPQLAAGQAGAAQLRRRRGPRSPARSTTRRPVAASRRARCTR